MSKTRKGRGRSIREKRRMKKSDLSVKKERRYRICVGKTDEKEEKGEKRGDWRMMSGDGKNRQNKRDERVSNHRSTTHHPNKLSSLNKLTR